MLNCPFHGGSDTPPFVVNKTSGLYFCFNPSCAEAGNLIDLLKRLTGKNTFEAQRFIVKRRTSVNLFANVLKSKMQSDNDYELFSQDVLDRMYDELWQSDKAQKYLHGRGFHDDTLKHFRVGYSGKKDMIITPMHDPKGNPVGLIGRTIEGKRFQNSKRLPRNRTLWNYHRAKSQPTVVVTESNFDAMRVWQAGYNAVAILGGYVSDEHLDQLGKTFTKIIIMTDDDKPQYVVNCRKCDNYCKGHNPGLDIGKKLIAGLPRSNMWWAHSNTDTRYFDGEKDAGGMTDEQIKFCIDNAVTNYQFMVQYN